ncbi:MAG: ATP phosphoribosyltransferase [Chloroflexota bacterium]
MRPQTDTRPVRLALPKGRFMSSTSSLLDEAGFALDDYNSKTRQYRLTSARFPHLRAKILQEKDISVHVSVGNYELGICGADWVRELKSRYTTSDLIEVSRLRNREGAVYLCSSVYSELTSVDAVSASSRTLRIASEYPNIANMLAAQMRLRRFRVFPLWGAASAYPPESADLVVMWAKNERELHSQGLMPLRKLFDVDAVVVANSAALSGRGMEDVLRCFSTVFGPGLPDSMSGDEPAGGTKPMDEALVRWQSREIRMAVPDGHQKTPATELFERAGLDIPGYAGKTTERRLFGQQEWLSVKVIRPQDMPLQVANGHFDIAVTGQDWLLEHLSSFPSSPVEELLDLGFGKVRVVAALSEDIPVNSTEELRDFVARGNIRPLRVASEYTNIADKYLRDNHIVAYKVMPTWGASEAFLPDDADLLVDNTQTGKTLVENRLKIIDVILRSSACVVANSNSLDEPSKREKIESLVSMLRGAVE